MAEIRHRIFALSLAAVFLITSVGFSIFVIISANSNNSPSTTTPTTTTTPTGPKLANFTPISHISSLTETDSVVGTGKTVAAGNTINVKYTGALAASGVIFQTQTTTINLSNVIPGWSEGIPGMKVGGTRRLLIPSSLAYGSTAQQTIPANSDLVFDVTVNSIN